MTLPWFDISLKAESVPTSILLLHVGNCGIKEETMNLKTSCETSKEKLTEPGGINH